MRSKITLAALCGALALNTAAASAQTMPADRTTYVTFSGPVSVPGMTLPAGTYTFRIADSQTDRHIVQIFNRDRSKLLTTLLAIPAERPEPEGDPVITFKESPSNMAPAVHYWYYAGDKAGNELVYPKNQAIAIARASGESVMSVDSEGTSIDDWKGGSMSRVSADTQEQQASAAAPQPTPAPEPTTPPAAQQPTTAPEQQPMTPQQSAPTATPSTPAPSAADNAPVGTSGSLPRTASELPLVGLIGLLAIAGALAIRAVRTA